MTVKFTLPLASVLAVLVTTGGAMAQSDAPRAERHGPQFEQLDTNGDGRLTRDEIFAREIARATAMDANGDGVLSLEEMQAHAGAEAKARAEAAAERRFKRLDLDGDGKLTASEALAGASDRMGAMRGHGKAHPRGGQGLAIFDADRDGEITKEEFEAGKEKMKERVARPGPRGPMGHDNGPGHGHGPKGGAEAPKQ